MYRVSRLKKGNGRRILGVVGGIVKHLNVDADPFWPRLATLIACIIQPIFILIYIGFALALPEETFELPEDEVESENEPKNFRDFKVKEESSEMSENE